jgi:hypothetical protein
MQEFLKKNYVLLSALLTSLIVTLTEFTQSGATDYKLLGMAALTAVLGVLANQWKGKGLTVTGIVGLLAGVFIELKTSGDELDLKTAVPLMALQIILALSGALDAYKPKDPLPPVDPNASNNAP